MAMSSFFFSSRRRHTRCSRDWSSDVCSSDLFDAARQRKRASVPSASGQFEHGLNVARTQLPASFLQALDDAAHHALDRKSTRLNSSHGYISYAVFCLKQNKHTPALLPQCVHT